ncbi:ESF1 homolog [Paramacrobiotus metropolitanus]|uniref:ESF1 homolog n=1 Tax=Paramacrobiotus metropolitanus TaxID=2943436 RepID=UPI00244574D8|nr:ESF1 homolog [Paramacrobiotus metropolitanus]
MAKTPSAPKKKAGSTHERSNRFSKRKKIQAKEHQAVSDQDHILKDERFSRIATDPRFRGIPKEEKKVRIDPRFQTMFTDTRFNQKHTVDRRGRPVNFASSDNLEKFYQLNDKRKNEEKSSNVRTKTDNSKKAGVVRDERFHLPGSQFPQDAGAPESGSSDSEEDDLQRDFSRGIGNLSSSSDESDDESESEVAETGEIEHPWAEMSADAPDTSEITRRLGLVNIDWDSIRAEDIFMVLNSFKPIQGVIKSVAIYPSEFGLQRMKAEEHSGPMELKDSARSQDDEEEDAVEEDTEDTAVANEKLRKYQLNRLKYYYAVVECDSSETANKIYEECDGLEYENSSAALDLRFIPDEMEFDHEPKSKVTSLPANYKPSEFVISALQQSRVRCSWDETSRDRKPLTANEWEKVDDLQAYLASSSSEEEDEAEDEATELADTRSVVSNKDPASIAKYRSLLNQIDNKNTGLAVSDEEDIDMEAHWEPDVETTAKEQLKIKQKQDSVAKMTPFEKMLEKQKEKRKAKKRSRKQSESPDLETAWNDEGSDDLEGSSEEDSEQSSQDEATKQDLKGAKRAVDSEDGSDVSIEKSLPAASLELLMGEKDSSRHFNLKKLLVDAKDTKAQKRKRRKLLKKSKTVLTEGPSDDFIMDLQDPRFKALFNSKDFNIDISDPSFKKTKAMETVIQEKLKRKETAKERGVMASAKSDQPKLRPDLSSLAKSVKAKFNGGKKK